MSSSVEICPIPIDKVAAMWHVAQPMLEKALKHSDGELTDTHIYNTLMNGERALWIVFKNDKPIASITTRIDKHKSGLKVCVIDFAGGESFKEWDTFTDYIEPYYASMGCTKMEIAGRAGWLRLHTAKNFKLKYCILRRDISHG